MLQAINSGQNYTLGELFSGDFIIEIPDMQRDYCWATTISENNNESLVYNFIQGLIEQSNNSSKSLQMGLLYAYESPKFHLQLCDGQQRITTLYLTLGVLFQKLRSGETKNQIKELLTLPNRAILTPRFQYAIRETTLTFLTDLVSNVWLNENAADTSIKESDWYFNEYNQDPSIQNIIAALRIINTSLDKLEDEQGNKAWDELAKFLLHDVTFLYFDMVNRTYGEEQFVVLNTTGKPLTKTENLKPKILGELDDIEVYKDGKSKLQYFSDMWENWENFFWKNKHQNHSSADKGFNEFLRWIYIIETTELESTLSSEKENYRENQKALANQNFDILLLNKQGIELLMELIQSYFEALDKLGKDEELKNRFLFNQNPLSQIQCFEFLPLLFFVKSNKNELSERSFIRLRKFLLSRAKDENVSKASITTAIEAIKLSKLTLNRDIADPTLSVSSTIISNEEKRKFKIYRSSLNREELEDAFWEAEDYECTKGNISYLLNVVYPYDCEGDFPIEEFKKLSQIVADTLNRPNDKLRRTLLTFGNYTIKDGWTPKLRGNRYSLGMNGDFFERIGNNIDHLSEQSGILQNFLTTALKQDDIETWMKQRIDEYNGDKIDNVNHWIKALIKDEEYLKFSNQKNLCITEGESTTYYILANKKVTSENTYKIIEPWQNIEM